MKYPRSMRMAALAAALGACSLWAQTAPGPAPSDPAPVVSDVGPAPPQERNSIGAIVLEDSLVPARRDRDFERTASPPPCSRQDAERGSAQVRKPARSSRMGQSGRSSP